MTYTDDQVREFHQALDTWLNREDALIVEFFARDFRCSSTNELVKHGLGRRLASLKHCIKRTFEILPPSNPDPDDMVLMDTTIYLQTFVTNTYGAIDNLARIWCIEANLCGTNGKSLHDSKIGLTPTHEIVRESLSQPFQTYLGNTNAWFAYLKNYRHALAHRIPLYIPPRQLSDADVVEYRRIEQKMLEVRRDYERYGKLQIQQGRLGVFNPVMMHSYGEGAKPVLMHPQMICDFATVVEIGELMLHELVALPASGRC